MSLSSEVVWQAFLLVLQEDLLFASLLANTRFLWLFLTSQEELLPKLSFNLFAGNMTEVNSVGPPFSLDTDLLIALPSKQVRRFDRLRCGLRRLLIMLADLWYNSSCVNVAANFNKNSLYNGFKSLKDIPSGSKWKRQYKNITYCALFSILSNDSYR